MNRLITIIIICICLPVFSQNSIPEVSLKITKLQKISDTDYILEYSVTYKGPDPKIFSDYSVYIPEEAQIIEGTVDNSGIHERDFLFTRINVDLNRNRSLEDFYTISSRGGDILLNGTKLNPLYSKAGNREIFTPRTSSAEFSLNRTGESGRPFTLHNYERSSGVIKIGLAPENGDISFAKLPNAQALIEIISDTENPGSINTSIDDARIYRGTTNENIPDLPGDYYRPRTTGSRHIAIKEGINDGSFKFGNPGNRALIRVTIFFSLSGRICIFDRKTVAIKE